ncbi:cytochrome P450 [soil metagenome]
MIDKSLDNAIANGANYGTLERQHAMFTRLRNEDPVHWTEPDGYRPFWTISKNADIMQIERDQERFLNAPRQRLVSIDFETELREKMGGRKNLSASMNVMDGDRHRLYRNITATWFLPKQLKTLEDRLAVLANKAVDDLAAKGPEFDFYKDIAIWYPLRVIMLILGLPDEDAPHLQRLTSSYFSGSDPGSVDKEMQTAGDVLAAVRAFTEYFDVVAKARRQNPTDDVASVIANATVDGRPLEHYEASAYYISLAAAGHDTTSASIAGGVLELIRNPDQWRRLQADPALITPAVEEMIRWVSPIKHFFRTAAVDVEIRGKMIKAGEGVMLSYPSANRDEEVFGDPFQFRVDRTPNKHVGFGYGVHMCLGMMLAKLEMKIFFQELLKRVDHFEMNGEPAWVETAFAGGLKRMPVRVKMK